MSDDADRPTPYGLMLGVGSDTEDASARYGNSPIGAGKLLQEGSGAQAHDRSGSDGRIGVNTFMV